METSLDHYINIIDKIEIPFLFLEVKGDFIGIDYANHSTRSLLGYSETDDLYCLDLCKVFLFGTADFKCTPSAVKEYLKTTTNTWIFMDVLTKDGKKVPVGINAFEYKEGEETYFIAILRDRTDSVKSECDLKDALADARAQKEAADKAKEEALVAKETAENNLFIQKKLSAQVDLLRYIFKGVMGLIILLCGLVVLGWMTGKYEKDSLSMFERILLVLTGMLGTAMAGVFDSKRSGDITTK